MKAKAIGNGYKCVRQIIEGVNDRTNSPRPVFAAPKLDFGVKDRTGHRKFPLRED